MNTHDRSLRSTLLFLWELFLVITLCCLFILFMEALQGDRDLRTHYSLYLFHLIFPPLLFGVVTWATGSFRAGRLLCCTILAAAILSVFLTVKSVAANLWILALCLLTVCLFQRLRRRRPPRKQRSIRTRDPVEIDPELEQRLSQERRRERKHRTASKQSRPIPVNRNWPIERI